MKKNKTKNEYRTYEEVLFEDLKNPEMAAAYLNAALMDEDPRMLWLSRTLRYKIPSEFHSGRAAVSEIHLKIF
jgi:DNA-binding phage protein